VDAEPHEIAQLQEALYDLREESLSLTETEHVVLDWLPYEQNGQRVYLAVALEEGQLLAWESTPYLHDAFWRQFIRRIEAITPPATEYTFRHTLPTLQLLPSTFNLPMALAA
ncbi:MAG: hypothetical protein KC496_04570, partial [Anaerolineae bacterium]|nr:hypothetical protein [Anaerolineae bacterium]